MDYLRCQNRVFLPVTVATFLLIVLAIQESNPYEAQAIGGKSAPVYHPPLSKPYDSRPFDHSSSINKPSLSSPTPSDQVDFETLLKSYQNETDSTLTPHLKKSDKLQGERPQTSRKGSEREADLARVRTEQQQLQALGYYDGPIDGITGPKTVAAIDRFTKDYGLSDTEWHSQKGQKLRQAATGDSKKLRSLNATSDGAFQVFLLRLASAKDSLYIMHGPDGRVLIRGSDLSEMVARVDEESVATDAPPSIIYFAVRGGTEDQFNALASTLRILQKTNPGSRRIQALFSAQNLALDPKVFFAKGVTLNREPIITQDGSEYSLRTSVRYPVAVGAKVAAIRVVAKSREILEALIDILHQLFASPNPADLSVAAIVAHCRSELIKKYDLTEEQLQFQIESEIGNIHVVHQFKPFNIMEPNPVYFN